MMDQQHSARRAFKYNGTYLDRGWVLTLEGCANDEKLARLGFFAEVLGNPTLYPCGICGAPFLSDRQRTAHGNRAHEGARDPKMDAPQMTKKQGQSEVNRIMNDPDYTPVLKPDETINDQDKANVDVPVFMEKTEASVKGGYGVPEVNLGAPPKPEVPEENPFDAGVKAGYAAAAEGKSRLEPGDNPYEPMPDPIIMEPMEKKPLTGRNLKQWRTKQKLNLKNAAEVLGVLASSISRAEKSRKKPLGSKLAPALAKALGR